DRLGLARGHPRAMPLNHHLVLPTLDDAPLAPRREALRPQRAARANQATAGIPDAQLSRRILPAAAHRSQQFARRAAIGIRPGLVGERIEAEPAGLIQAL